MTVIMRAVLRCQGKAGACLASLTIDNATAHELRAQARLGGWRANHDGSKDLCPACAGPVPEGCCAACREHPEVEYRDSLGHDGLGHRLANLLASHGIVTREQFQSLSAPQLRKIKGLGEGGKGRIGWAQNNPSERFRP